VAPRSALSGFEERQAHVTGHALLECGSIIALTLLV
jgi:hypothetical protein